MTEQPSSLTARFNSAFATLQGSSRAPFPWQQRLFGELAAGRIPSALDLPTGLGKTSVIAIWLIARALADAASRRKLPRRLVYVVDRRAVVDQATAEADRFRTVLDAPGEPAAALKAALGLGAASLPISTLRGQHADNREWLADPTVPAIVVGTVDMIGSRLLFSGYGVSRRMRPFHAGLLGADTLLVLDEAHLAPPFEALLKAIAQDQRSYGPRPDGEADADIPPFRLLSLSATSRAPSGGRGATSGDDPPADTFRLDEDDRHHPIVARRLGAAKALTIHDAFDGKATLVDELAERAWALGRTPARVLVYCDSRDDAEATRKRIEKLAKSSRIATELLVGQRRVHEREGLQHWLEQHGFTGGSGDSQPPEAPTFLVATAAGEVGIDLDADHIVCDLVAWERMVQRLGRVNRRGGKSARIEVVALPRKSAAKAAEPWPDRLTRLRAPFELLPRLDDGSSDASPGAIRTLPSAAERLDAAQTKPPLRPALTRALVDAWSMTSLEQHAGRPEIQPWLRGWEDEEDTQCVIVWRRHLPVRKSGEHVVAVDDSEINAFFEAAPPQLSEMLEADTRPRVANWLFERIAAVRAAIDKQETAGKPALLGKDEAVLFVLDAKDELVDGGVWTLRDLARLDGRDKERFVARLPGRTLVLSSQLGGLTKQGMLAADADEPPATLDSDEAWTPRPFRVREAQDNRTAGKSSGEPSWKRASRFASEIGADEEPKRWLIVEESRAESEAEDSRAVSIRAQTLSDHQQAVRTIAHAFAQKLGLPQAHAEMIALAAVLHDEGKDVWRWQRAFNAPRGVAYAKTEGPVLLKLLDGYRHEVGSLIRIDSNDDVKRLPDGLRDLLLHLVAAHHGQARPLISTKNCEGAGPDLDALALEAALRFERLQRRWGPWGLAWWEALLRAADQKASRENDASREVEHGQERTARSA
ncbi:type I-G CRISPR-associated helicase/endonuclease Cas3g [Bradyrhizobium oligotrophicum]|uniref:type I-G CRISPR-associated helicase/endonuclease Cas3g n=1 Tax=Bradyrhizobium oligotrophicum TaxID=44255 RepID=UPI003EC08E94